MWYLIFSINVPVSIHLPGHTRSTNRIRVIILINICCNICSGQPVLTLGHLQWIIDRVSKYQKINCITSLDLWVLVKKFQYYFYRILVLNVNFFSSCQIPNAMSNFKLTENTEIMCLFKLKENIQRLFE